MGKLRILMYHKVDMSRKDYLTVSQMQLQKQLKHIKSNYNVIRLSDVLSHIRTGSPLPEKALLITFDDGYANNYTLAWPLLKAFNLPFAVFPVADFIGKTTIYDGAEQTFLSLNQMAEMSPLAEFGYHGLAHANLNQLDDSGKAHEIHETVKKMESLGMQVLPMWAYTYGSHPRKNKSALANLANLFISNGIYGALRIGNRVNKLPIKRPFAIQRIDIRGNDSSLIFSLKVRFGKVL